MSCSKVLSFLLLIVTLASAACMPQATPTAVPTAAPATQSPVATEAPATKALAEPVTLTVLAAASLTASFTELAEIFQTANPGATVEYSFAGSQELAQQLEQGAEADVFASASKKYMEAAIASARVNADDSKVFVRNRLVVIFPKDNHGGLTELKDLTKEGLKLDLADQSVPVGHYSLDFLDKAIADPAFDPQFKDNVLKNVVSYETNVKAVVSKVALGEADAGIVYVTDITADIADKVGKLDIPDALNTIATYPIAPIADSKNAELAQAFVDMILSPEGQEVMGKYGFIPAAGSSSSSGVPITDAFGREVKLAAAPKHIVMTGKALFIAGIGNTAQGSGNFIQLIDTNYEAKVTLEIVQTINDALKPRVLVLCYNDKDGDVALDVPPQFGTLDEVFTAEALSRVYRLPIRLAQANGHRQVLWT